MKSSGHRRQVVPEQASTAVSLPVNPAPAKSSTAFLESAIKQLTAVLAALYGLGLCLTNFYLAHFGVTTFSAVKVQYIFTGLLFLIVLVAPSAAFILPFYQRYSPWRWKNALMTTCALGGTFILTTLVLGLVMDYDSQYATQYQSTPVPAVWAWRLYHAGTISLVDDPYDRDIQFTILMSTLWIPLFNIPIIVDCIARRRARTLARGTRVALGSTMALGVMLFSLSYVHEIHPRLKGSFGGGFLGLFDVAISGKENVAVENAGVRTEPAVGLPMALSALEVDRWPPRVLRNVWIIHEDGDSVFVRCETYYSKGHDKKKGAGVSLRIPRREMLLIWAKDPENSEFVSAYYLDTWGEFVHEAMAGVRDRISNDSPPP